MIFPRNPFGFSSGSLDDARLDLERAKEAVDTTQSEVGSFLQQSAGRQIEKARQQMDEFNQIHAALEKNRAIRSRADTYQSEMRPHGFVWDVERKLKLFGGFFTLTENRMLGLKSGLWLGVVFGFWLGVFAALWMVKFGGVKP